MEHVKLEVAKELVTVDVVNFLRNNETKKFETTMAERNRVFANDKLAVNAVIARHKKMENTK